MIIKNTNEKALELIKLVLDNPSLPIVPLVDGEIIVDDTYGRWLASFGSAYVGEIACYKERYFEDHEDFIEYYYDHNCDELCQRFDYTPRFSDDWPAGKILKNETNEQKLNKYLADLAEENFTKAIIVYIETHD